MHFGWLSKLSMNNTFGSSRWQSRYFVLLDSELRYYKHEHATAASKTINLKDISGITILQDISHHPYAFRLEPSHPTLKKKYWLLSCQSELEMRSWVTAINIRLNKLSPKSISRRRGMILSQLDVDRPMAFAFQDSHQDPFMTDPTLSKLLLPPTFIKT